MFINPLVYEKSSVYRQDFETAQPFKHLVIDNFLVTEQAASLLEKFPSFNPQKAISELGKVGGKAVNENLISFGGIYQQFAQYVEQKEFLDLITSLTGIDNLIPDPSFYGGGTHENLHGQELDPHVDFNLDERHWYHRRLNLLIYLNPQWQSDWGGSLELHSNPRQPEENRIKSFLPIFNRCVIFETNEYSWHGFSQINLPENQQHLSRKSLSIYLYTKEHPAEEITASHTTFYIPRPLPESIQPNQMLKEEDYQQIKILLKRRDDLIRFYQDREIKESHDLVSLKSHIKRYLSTQYPHLWRMFKSLPTWKK
jgi:2OG-Fe(II) oxygenase superfamily